MSTAESAVTTAVVLAAGLGTRMHSPLAKVLHPLLGRPMVGWVVVALREAGVRDIVLVVHHQEAAVRAAVSALDPGVRFVRQAAPRGTGDALASALPMLPPTGTVLVTAGDTPLLGPTEIARLLDAHHGPVTVAAFDLANPHGYGRVIPGVGIVEQGDCTPDQVLIRTVNSGMYAFDAEYLHRSVPLLQPNVKKGEYYATDLVGPEGAVLSGFSPHAFAGVNDKAQLAEARGLLRRRVNRRWAESGVDFADLDSASVDVGVQLSPRASLGVGVVLEGRCEIAGDVGHHTVMRDTVVAKGARILEGCVCEGARVDQGAVVGPLARLRPGAWVREGAHVGNYVEVKNTVIGVGAKANHLSYLGDAQIGAGANIGAGTITCNYDGFKKHKTHIGERAFIGSNAALVAPVSIGDGAIVGAGSVITQDVPEDAIAVARGAQKNHEGAARRFRLRAQG